ncbi:hypothetical protein TRFO_16833 [Tritrichomonas foetus]|uniref:Myb-like domain-containing protein n=1 Tax=Tritrichomonas foetus TaxID=1144522 RepID=A0A1J4KPJ5_9EUKA|nr:hypothetical protein TRFO_16833 [Tritrichomonas foetus]|eukprot:OHT13163.1 hypothetical protein TRFO_16833 [Tritrichomonas foetus]
MRIQFSNQIISFSMKGRVVNKLKHRKFTEEMDQILLNVINQFFPMPESGERINYKLVTEEFNRLSPIERTQKQIRERYTGYVSPLLNKQWTESDKQLCIELFQKYGNHWGRIAAHFPHKSSNIVHSFIRSFMSNYHNSLKKSSKKGKKKKNIKKSIQSSPEVDSKIMNFYESIDPTNHQFPDINENDSFNSSNKNEEGNNEIMYVNTNTEVSIGSQQHELIGNPSEKPVESSYDKGNGPNSLSFFDDELVESDGYDILGMSIYF